MSHANARLTPRGREIAVLRVRAGWSRAHVAAAMGCSRSCVTRWVERFEREGVAGLQDRSSRPGVSPTRTAEDAELEIVRLRVDEQLGRDRIAQLVGVSPRTVSRVLARRGAPPLTALDPMTGDLIRTSKQTAVRYERARPGELVHMNVKKLGRIPDGGGWRANGRGGPGDNRDRKHGSGYDFVHSLVDDHSRLAYSEVLADERGSTCAGFLRRAAAYFASCGIARIERVMTDNALAYRRSKAFAEAVVALGARHVFIRPHCPWQNGKVERFNRTLQTEWAYRQPFTSNAERAAALAPWLERYNTERIHSALGAPPITRTAPRS